ncbi:MAG: N-acetylmuramoyl-L-alanine amidase [Sphaerochaetaceae bacterium]|nr:N-acetylmuramoyl-L-alanine amidase [Sphaerochaetaceae bacterium]
MGKKVILDNGHGGVINGVYQTAGKRSPKWSKGVLYEGMFNRWVVNRLIEKLDRAGIPYYHISPELLDVSLQTRVKRANAIYEKDKNVYILSIHANAGGGKGVEGFTTEGYTNSDLIGEVFLENLEKDLVGQKMRFDRTDGDRDKEVNYYILRKPIASAFLLECGFMDNEADYNNLWDENYIETLVESLFCSIKEIYNK